MKRTIITNRLDVIGRIWMPDCIAAMSYTPSDYDLDNIREDGVITREGVQRWCDTHCGDFQEVTDFSADFGDGEFVSDWADEDSELVFNDCMGEWE